MVGMYIRLRGFFSSSYYQTKPLCPESPVVKIKRLIFQIQSCVVKNDAHFKTAVRRSNSDVDNVDNRAGPSPLSP